MRLKNKQEVIEFLNNYKSIYGLRNFYISKLDDSIKHDIDTLEIILKRDGNIYNMLTKEEKNNRILVKAASESNTYGICLSDFPKKYHHDKEIVLNMIGRFGHSIRYETLDKNLQEDKDIIISMINNDLYEITESDENNHLIPKFSDRFNTDKDIVIELIKNTGIDGYEYADQTLRKNFDVISACFYTNPKLLLDNPNLASKHKLMLDVIRHNLQAIKYVSKDLLSNEYFAKAVVEIDARTIPYLSDELQLKYQDILEEYLNNIKNIASKAADWWLDISTEINKVTVRNIDSYTKSVIESVFINKHVLDHVEDYQKDIFKESITKYITEQFLKGQDEVLIVNGNHANKNPLIEAREKASISIEFPWNTYMNITQDNITVNKELIYSKNETKDTVIRKQLTYK